MQDMTGCAPSTGKRALKWGDPAREGAWSSRRRWASLALPAFFTWALCSWGIGISQFRGDELCTWWAATLPDDGFQRLVSQLDAVLAPYYLLMRGWIRVFGDSESAMRAPSALAMGLCAATTAALGERLFGRRVGWRAGWIFALIPVVSRYGQEARPYAFAACFAALSTLLLLRLLDRPQSWKRGAAYAAALTGLGLSHLVALLILPAHAICMVRLTPRSRPYVRVRRRSLATFLLAATAGTSGDLLLAIVGAHQLPDQIGRRGTASELVGLAHKLVDGSTVGSLLIGATVIAVGLRTLLSTRQPLLLKVWAALPPAFLLATYSILHLWALRYLLFTLPALALLTANALERPSANGRLRAWTTPIIVTVLVVLGLRMQLKSRSSLARASGDYRAMGQVLRTHALEGDAVAFGGREVARRIPRLALEYELRHGPKLADIFVARSLQELGRFTAEECRPSRACLSSTTQRLWLLTSAPPSNLFKGMPKERARLLKKEFAVSKLYPAWNANLALLTRYRPSRVRAPRSTRLPTDRGARATSSPAPG